VPLRREQTVAALIVLLAGAVPIFVVHGAYALNVLVGAIEGCNPYWDGCFSVSRAVRSGPGLWLFKAMALPNAALMIAAWLRLPSPVTGPALRALGVLGALFFLVYAAALGTDGDFYRWMRRYGVVFYFGFTGLSQLLVAGRLRTATAWLPRPAMSRRFYWAVLVATWSVGVTSALKRRLVDDPAVVDRLQNVLEWAFALGLSMGFVALASLIYQASCHQGSSENPESPGS